MTRHLFDRRRWLLAAGLTLAVAAGCGGPESAPVDATKARDALRSALDSWKRGEKPDRLHTATPPVFVTDPDWMGGGVLREFKLLDDGAAMDSNLHVKVRLTVRPAGGEEFVTRDVTYVVGTAPNLSVSRKVF